MYAKLFTSIYQGTLRGDSHGLLVFTNLLAHAERDGTVDLHPRAIAEEIGLTLDQVKATLLVLEAPDPESRSPELDGRRIVRMDEHRAWGWHIVNHAKYNAIRNADDRREQNRLAQERWRAKQDHDKQSKPRKPESAHIDVDVDVDVEANTEEPKTKTTTARKRAAPAVLVSLSDLVADGVDEQHATDWLVARKAKGLPLTPTAWAGVKAEAIKARVTPGEAIKAAAGNGWAGFKASWLHEPARNGPAPSAHERKAAEAAKWMHPEGRPPAFDYVDMEPSDAPPIAIR